MDADEQRCPACAADEITGSMSGDEVVLRCGACDHRWARGERPCLGCGGTGLTTAPQLLTHTPRGNQLSVVGRRQVVVCPACDAEVLEAYLQHGTPLPSTYVSAARRLTVTDQPLAPAPEPPRPSHAPARPAQAQAVPEPAPAKAAAVPTVRQAIEAFQEAEADHDPVALIMLGRQLGPAQRLSDPAVLRTVAGDLPDHPTVEAFVRFCRTQGWLSSTS